jgi:hypothetical protein
MSTLNVSNISDGTDTVGTSYVVNGSAKVWCDLNHTTNTINDSFNVSSMTDTGTGVARINYSSSMSSSYYSASALSVWTTVTYTYSVLNSHTSTHSEYVSFGNVNYTTPYDATSHLMTVNGDLA